MFFRALFSCFFLISSCFGEYAAFQENTQARRFLRDTCGLSQTFSQNIGDAVQYAGEAALLFCTFGSGNATKTAQLAGKTVPIPELATTVNRTAKIAEFEMAVAGSGDRILYNLRAVETSKQYSKFLNETPKYKGRVNWAEKDLGKRGLDYENKVCKSKEFADFIKCPDGAEAFDMYHFGTDHGLSIKTLDTQTPARLADPSQITSTLNSYITKMNNFKGIRRGKFKVESKQVKLMTMYVGVPNGTTQIQFKAIQKSARTAELNDIKLVVRIEE
jgi:hypothetical protein